MNIRDWAYSVRSSREWNHAGGPGDAEAAKTPERAEASGRRELLRQIKDPERNFFGEMQQQILENAEKRQEEQRKQAVVDALGKMLDSLSGKTGEAERDTAHETAGGIELGLNADQRCFKAGYIPLELQVYLRSLGDGTAFQLGEADEDQDRTEDPEDGSSRTDSVKRKELSGEDSLDGDVPARAPAASADSDFRDLADIRSQTEIRRKQIISAII